MSDHEQLWEEIRGLDKKVSDQQERFYTWADAQDGKRAEFEDKIIDKLDGIKQALAQKTEMDSAMISQLSELRKRVEAEETGRKACDQIIYETSFAVKQIVDRLQRHDLSKMSSDIDASHEKLRDHEDRLRPLEKREGKLARNILEKLALTLVGGGAGYVISLLLKGN